MFTPLSPSVPGVSISAPILSLGRDTLQEPGHEKVGRYNYSLFPVYSMKDPYWLGPFPEKSLMGVSDVGTSHSLQSGSDTSDLLEGFQCDTTFYLRVGMSPEGEGRCG